MPEYRRSFLAGGTFFFTVVTYDRRPILCEEKSRSLLRASFREVREDLPFEIPAFVLLPDHLHCIWQLPEDDGDFSTRWARIKKGFTQRWVKSGGREGEITDLQRLRHERGVWQRRFWEHTIRDDEDYALHMDYIHYNPVKHGLVECPHAWPYSSFSRLVSQGVYDPNWLCVCGGERVELPDWSGLDDMPME